MNNTFNFNRFGKLLALDGRKYIRNFGITLAILCGLNLVLWLLTLIFGFTMPTFPRYVTIYMALLLGIILVPSKAFGNINLPREGVGYAMLPVSNLEKFFSYLLFCLLTPVVIILGSWAVDSLLTLLPFGGFTHYIKHLGIGGVVKDFVVEMTELTDYNPIEEDFASYDSLMNMLGPNYNYYLIQGIIFNTGLFMFGNLLFKTHKAGKTLAVVIGISYVLSMIMQLIVIGPLFHQLAENPEMFNSFETVTDITTSTMSISNILRTILAIGLYVGLFFKLKTQKY